MAGQSWLEHVLISKGTTIRMIGVGNVKRKLLLFRVVEGAGGTVWWHGGYMFSFNRGTVMLVKVGSGEAIR